MNLNLDDMKVLLERARKSGTVDRWADIAIEWMEAASKRVDELAHELAVVREQP